MRTPWSGMALAAVCGILASPAVAYLSAQGQDAQTKGVERAYQQGKKPGVQTTVYKKEGTRERLVRDDYEFKSGDQFVVKVETNQPAYVYVLNRTLSGDPARMSEKGIERVRNDDRIERGDRAKYTLLYPLEGDRAARTKPGTPFAVPDLRMNSEPGVEKIYVVVSAKPINIGDYFDTSGKQRTGRRRTAPAAGTNDTDEDVLGQLNKDLADWNANAEVSAKGVERATGVARDAAKPAMAELTLKHFGK